MSNLSGSGTIRGAISQGGGGSSDVYWDDILDKPTFAEVATSGDYDDLSNKPDLAEVATSGDYDDLSNKPNIPVYTAGTGIDITNNVISATGGGGFDLEPLYVGTGAAQSVELSESYKNFDIIIMSSAHPSGYSVSGIYITDNLSNGSRIGYSDDVAFQWWEITDNTHFYLQASSGDYYLKSIYGLHRKTEG